MYAAFSWRSYDYVNSTNQITSGLLWEHDSCTSTCMITSSCLVATSVYHYRTLQTYISNVITCYSLSFWCRAILLSHTIVHLELPSAAWQCRAMYMHCSVIILYTRQALAWCTVMPICILFQYHYTVMPYHVCIVFEYSLVGYSWLVSGIVVRHYCIWLCVLYIYTYVYIFIYIYIYIVWQLLGYIILCRL